MFVQQMRQPQGRAKCGALGAAPVLSRAADRSQPVPAQAVSRALLPPTSELCKLLKLQRFTRALGLLKRPCGPSQCPAGGYHLQTIWI